MMPDSAYSQEDFCKELFKTFDAGMWKWDDRFDCVLAEFSVYDQDIVRMILKRHLNSVWDTSNVDTAPETVQRINDHFGGLMSRQMLFTSEPGQGDLLCCAWWPWGNGETISIRVAPFLGKLPEPQRIERINLFKGWFGMNS